MVSNGVLLFCVAMVILIAQFSALVGLFVSIGLCAIEVVWLWVEEVERVGEIG
jgi:hypothetical protein